MNDKDLQHLAAIVRDSDDAIIGKTLEGIITSWNMGAELIYGYTPEEAIGRTVAMLVPPDREDELPTILQNLSQGQGITHYDTLRVTKDGRLVNVSLTVSPIRDASGTIIGASSIGRDVTKEKEAENALRESARAYKLLMEQASDAILVSYPDQPLIEVNQRASDMLGYTREELLQLRKAVSPQSEGIYLLPHRDDEILDGGIVYAEQSVRRKDGTVIITELSTRRLDDGRIVTIARDISERKHTEEKLQRREAQLLEAQEIAHIGSWQWDMTTGEVSWSDELYRIFGVDPQTLPASLEAYDEHIHPDDRAMVTREAQRTIRERGSFNYEHRVLRADGSIRIICARGKVLVDESGNPFRLIGTGQDITESKLAQEQIQFQAQILDQVQASIIATDLEGTVTHWNRHAEKLYGWKREDALGRHIGSLTVGPQDGELANEIMAQVMTQGWWEGEFTVRRKDGSTFPASVVDTVIRDGVGQPIGITGISSDITERKRTEEAVQQSEKRFRALIEHNADAIILSNAEGIVLYASPSASQILGTPLDELVGLNGFTGMHPDDVARSMQIHSDLLQEPGVPMPFEARFQHRDGSWHWLEGTATNLLDEPAVGAIVGNYRDTTERKRTELALQNSEERFRALIENSADGITVVGADGLFTYASDSSQRIVGYAPEELVGLNPMQFLHPDDKASVGKLLLELIEKPNGSITTEYRVLHKDGSWLWVESTMSNLLAEQTVQALVFNYRDITERKRAEEALRTDEKKFRGIFDNTLDAMFISDDKGIFVEVNAAACAFTGLRPEDLVGHSYAEFQAWKSIAEDEKIQEQILAGGRAAGQSGMVNEKGELRHTEFSTIQNFIPGYSLTVVHDLTERKKTEEARLARESAEQANHAKSEFLSRMSHELRTPLNAILGFSQVLEMDVTIPDQQESLGYILKAGRHLLNLIDEVLDLTRIEEGNFEFSIEPVLVRDVMQETLDLVKPLAAHRDIRIEMDMAWMDSCIVMADRQRLQQVLINLLANAIKYNREGGTVTVSCNEVNGNRHGKGKKARGRVRLEVSDTGPGLSPDKVVRLFLPFDRLGAEQSEVEGTGLGLAISKSLMEAMGGTIGVESEEGGGCAFWVELAPADEPVAQAAHKRKVSEPLIGDQIEGQDRTILCIEDNLSNIRLIERILAKRPQTRLLTAMQGQIGLDIAAEHNPDLILLDVHLPDMLGDEVLRQLQANPRTASIPVVMLSADANPRRADELLAAGAKAYATKPIDVKQFRTILEESLERIQTN